jgi:very-short-patch-repair endonuclease
MSLIANARTLRKRSTDAEIKLWNHLRARRLMGLKFRRQCPLGCYIVDFICIEEKLIIELDGGQHNENRQHDYDERRTEFLNGLGFKVIRFWNNDVLSQFDVVLDEIYKQVGCGV